MDRIALPARAAPDWLQVPAAIMPPAVARWENAGSELGPLSAGQQRKVPPELGIGHSGGTRILYHGFSMGQQAGYAQRHGQPVVPVALAGRSGQAARSVNHHPVLPRLDVGSQAGKLGDSGFDAVRLFNAQLGGIANDRGATGEAGGNRQYGYLVQDSGDYVPAQLDTGQLPGGHQ